VTWADWLILLTLAVAFWGGYRSGVLRESIGLASIIVAAFVAGALAGPVTPPIQRDYAVAPASAHLIAFWSLFLVAFALVRLAGWAAERTIAAPAFKVASGLGGGVVACAKAVLALWAILFVALFFPIAPDVRTTLRASPTVRLIEGLDAPAYAILEGSLTGNARYWARVFLKHHHL
jgi:uncharacterized membrane protein required for colicin V production